MTTTIIIINNSITIIRITRTTLIIIGLIITLITSVRSITIDACMYVRARVHKGCVR